MKDKELRKLIGSRAKQRRLELNLTQPYVAEKMGVTASTILRYENGSIDNTKKMVLEGLSEDVYKRQGAPLAWVIPMQPSPIADTIDFPIFRFSII